MDICQTNNPMVVVKPNIICQAILSYSNNMVNNCSRNNFHKYHVHGLWKLQENLYFSEQYLLKLMLFHYSKMYK